MGDGMLRFGIAPANWGAFGDPRRAAELASIAEDAGWDGYFTWDGLPVSQNPPPTFDPWVILASVATATQKIRIGTCVAVVPRYKPPLLAMRLASLDVLSGGRMILGVGIGDRSSPRTFETFGEPKDPQMRAEMLDEALEIITRLWSGEKLDHHGKHYEVDGFSLTAKPAQHPRIPIWVGGDSGAAMRRAASWDGWIGPDENPSETSPEDVAAVTGRLEKAGARLETFDIAWAGQTTPDDSHVVRSYGTAGATWWIEILLGKREEILTRVTSGPPVEPE